MLDWQLKNWLTVPPWKVQTTTLNVHDAGDICTDNFFPPIFPHTPKSPTAPHKPTAPHIAIAGNISPLEEWREFDAWR